MPLVREHLSKAQLAFRIAGDDESRFQVIRYCGTEGLCQLYRFEVELASTESAVPFADTVGKPAVLSIDAESGKRWFHGIISRFEMTGETTGQTYFRAELVPGLWLLTHRYNSRIFQNKRVPEIISDVLAKGGIVSDRVRLDLLQRTYEPREYCVQYRETDYNFICRLMEEEGIRWYFEQAEDRHTLILADSATYTSIEGEPQLPYLPPSGMIVPRDHVFRFRAGQSVRPGSVALNDFNFENPKLDLQTSGDCQRDAQLEFYDYPGEYIRQNRGRDLATIRAEEFEAGRTLGVGQSNSLRLIPGRTFELADHPGGLDGPYLLTSLRYEGKQPTLWGTTETNGRNGVLNARLHQSLIAARQNDNTTIRELAEALLEIVSRLKGNDPTAHRALTQWLYHAGQVSRESPMIAEASGVNPLDALAIPNLLEDVTNSSLVDYDAPVYQCRFECIPASVSYRPPRVAPWPQMRGTQTARVVGPQSEEIYTDKYGRVKVQFNWDREGKFDENASCWIRVSQGMAGGAYGMMFLPRVGQEVIVDFLEGDPDKPIITGRVYNADHMPPYPLPDEKTKSCIKTHSTKGGGGTNEIRFEDLKDEEQILIHAQKDFHIRVRNDRIENVDHDHHLTVKEQKFELVKQNKHNEVKLDFNEKIGGNMSLEVTGDLGQKVGGNQSEEVSGYYALKSDRKVVIESPEITLKAGGNFVKIDAGGVTILGTMVKINSGGSAGIATMIAPTSPETPLIADTVLPGKDTRYSPGDERQAEVEPDAGQTSGRNGESKKKTSWIEIELVDEEGQPVPGEPYEIIAPDGETIRKGSLDHNGRAHVLIPDPGSCQISFPRLDARAWARDTGATPPQAAHADATDPAIDGEIQEGGPVPWSEREEREEPYASQYDDDDELEMGEYDDEELEMSEEEVSEDQEAETGEGDVEDRDLQA